jgi:hypothetical protein
MSQRQAKMLDDEGPLVLSEAKSANVGGSPVPACSRNQSQHGHLRTPTIATL